MGIYKIHSLNIKYKTSLLAIVVLPNYKSLAVQKVLPLHNSSFRTNTATKFLQLEKFLKANNI